MRTEFIKAWEAFLKEQEICFGREAGAEDPFYDLTFQASLPGILEYHVTVRIKAHTLSFEAGIPITSTDEAMVCALVNRLNSELPVGLYQYDRRDGELTWNHFLAMSDWQFPDREHLLKTLTLTHQRVSQLCLALLENEADKEDEAK